MRAYDDLVTQVPPDLRTRRARLRRVLAPFQPRPPFERSDAVVDDVTGLDFTREGDVVVASVFGLQRWGGGGPIWSVAHVHRWGTHLACIDGRILIHRGGASLDERDLETGELRCTHLDGLHVILGWQLARDRRSLFLAGSTVPGNPSGFSTVGAWRVSLEPIAIVWAYRGPDWQCGGRTDVADDGRVLVAISDKAARVIALDGNTGALETAVVLGGDAAVSGLSALGGDSFVVLRTPSKHWSEPSGLERWTSGVRERVLALPASGWLMATSPDRRYALIASFAPHTYLIDLEAMAVIDEIALPDPDLDRVTGLAFTPESDGFALGTRRGAVLLFDLTA